MSLDVVALVGIVWIWQAKQLTTKDLATGTMFFAVWFFVGERFGESLFGVCV